MADFVFKLSPNIILGNYSLARIGEEAVRFGTHFMLIADPFLKEQNIIQKIKTMLEEKNISVFEFDGFWKTADSEIIERAVKLARGACVQGIIACGGSAACAVGRAVSALYNETQSIYHFIEGVPAEEQPLPLIQIPTAFNDPFVFGNTTSVIDGRNKNVCLLKMQDLMCRLVFFDPNIYANFAPDTVNSMIFAGITLAFEAFISTKSNFFSETVSARALELFLTALNPNKEKLLGKSKEELAVQAACLAAIGAAASAPGAGTAIALAAAGRYEILEAQVSTVLLPHVMEDAVFSSMQKAALFAGMLNDESLAGTDEKKDFTEIVKSGVEKLKSKIAEAGLPVRLKDLGLTIESLVATSEDASKLSFMNYNPRPMSGHELFEIIKQAF